MVPILITSGSQLSSRRSTRKQNHQTLPRLADTRIFKFHRIAKRMDMTFILKSILADMKSRVHTLRCKFQLILARFSGLTRNYTFNEMIPRLHLLVQAEIAM
jgi:hypothetical protein